MLKPHTHTHTCRHTHTHVWIKQATDTDKQRHAVIMFWKLWIRQHSQVCSFFCLNFSPDMWRQWINMLPVLSVHTWSTTISKKESFDSTSKKSVANKFFRTNGFKTWFHIVSPFFLIKPLILRAPMASEHTHSPTTPASDGPSTLELVYCMINFLKVSTGYSMCCFRHIYHVWCFLKDVMQGL